MIIIRRRILIWSWRETERFYALTAGGNSSGNRDIFMYPIMTAISVCIILYILVWSRRIITTRFIKVIYAAG